MPIVASMGGIAGTQTVTLFIRGLALGQVQWTNARLAALQRNRRRRLQRHHLGGGHQHRDGVLVRRWKIAGVIAAAMLINLLAAAIVGVVVPLTLRRFAIDPALSAGVILTTFTDCIGFATLLGLGAWFLTSTRRPD
jgi:magnesium transporter